MKDSHKSVIVSLERTTKTERKCKSLMTTVTQEMKYRQSLICYARKYGVARASRKYNRPRSTIYFWLSRYDGTIESLANRSKRPHSHPNQHTEAELKLIRDMRRRNPRLDLIDLWCRHGKWGYKGCCACLLSCCSTPVSVHRHRRVLTVAVSGCLRRSEHLLLGELFEESICFLQKARLHRRMCPD